MRKGQQIRSVGDQEEEEEEEGNIFKGKSFASGGGFVLDGTPRLLALLSAAGSPCPGRMRE